MRNNIRSLELDIKKKHGITNKKCPAIQDRWWLILLLFHLQCQSKPNTYYIPFAIISDIYSVVQKESFITQTTFNKPKKKTKQRGGRQNHCEIKIIYVFPTEISGFIYSKNKRDIQKIHLKIVLKTKKPTTINKYLCISFIYTESVLSSTKFQASKFFLFASSFVIYLSINLLN